MPVFPAETYDGKVWEHVALEDSQKLRCRREVELRTDVDTVLAVAVAIACR